jgi:CubicO group peptidase (beta-lactamase class C family)
LAPGAANAYHGLVNREPAPDLPDVTVPDIDRALQTGIYEKTFSAAACMASVGDRIFHRAVYGSLAQPPPLRRVGPGVLFDLASLTKPLGAGLAALKLAGQNRLDLGASITTTIPIFRDSRFAPITIDMLLDHTSGWPATQKFWEEVREMDEGVHSNKTIGGTSNAVEAVQAMLAQVRFEAEPGQKTIYSDLNFMALGWIVEKIVGWPLDTYLMREIYRPLGIHEELFFVRLDDVRQRNSLRTRSFAATEDCRWRKRVLQGEVHDPNAWILGGVAGHAGLFGTVEAVWKLVVAMWQSLRGESREFLGGTVRRFWTRSKRLRDTTRTLAWDTPSAQASSCGKRFSRASVGHTGFTGTSIWIDPATDIIGVLLTNAAHPTAEGKKERMAKLRPRIYDQIAKYGEAQPAAPERKTGSEAFYSAPATGVGLPLTNPLRGPAKPGF